MSLRDPARLLGHPDESFIHQMHALLRRVARPELLGYSGLSFFSGVQMAHGDCYGFTGMDAGLASFVNLLQMIGGMEEREPGEWGDYLTCVSLMPGKGVKPTHPFFLPTQFDTDGPPESLTPGLVAKINARFDVLRDISRQLEEAMAGDDDPPQVVCDQLGPIAMQQIRGLGDDLEVGRWTSGEWFVWSLKLRRLLPPERIYGAQLIQISGEFAEIYEDPEELTGGKLPVSAHRLVYRLAAPPQPGIPTSEQSQIREKVIESVRITVRENFPTVHAIVELRDSAGATVRRSGVFGPSYHEVVAERAE